MEIRIIEKLDHILKLLTGEQIEDGYLDIKGVVKYTSLSRSSVFRACQDGSLKYNASQGKHLVRISDVEQWLSNK